MRQERTGWIMANLLLFIAFGLFCLCMSGCMTYNKALRKFGHLATDSARITLYDTVYIRKDSVVLRLKTDTTTFHRIIEQGRARISYDRNPRSTTIKAECKPDTIIRTLQAKCPPVATFGIAPWYKWAFYLTLGLLAIMVIAYIFLYQLKLSIAKR